ncbi:MAG: protein translocase subunit SecD [Candidatus Magasanikbacteria bacterium]|nr:protein translocase subunit SecD [Candidatus Magasanikbacteria bacterium]
MSSKPKTPVSSNTPSQVRTKFIAVVVLSIISLVVVAPGYVNTGLDRLNAKTNLGLPHVPNKKFSLGLDLQGGAHLIYQANTAQIAPLDRTSSVEGVRDVIERRVRGGLGVAEPLVQTTRVGESYRIIVELPGVTDVNQAIKMIGETPVLEFKEQNNEPPRDLTASEKKELDTFNAGQEKKAKEAATALRQGQKFEDIVAKYSEDDKTKAKGGDLGFVSVETFPELYTWAKTHQVGQVSPAPVKSFDGLNIVKNIATRDGAKHVSAAHLLLCFQGADRCDKPQYSKEQAAAKIAEIKKEMTVQNFTDLVKKYSTEPGAGTRGGDLGSFKKGDMVPEFETAVWDAPVGTIIGPVETKFGFHLIYKKSEESQKEYQLARVFLKLKQKTDIVPPQEPWKSTGLSGKQLKRAEVTDDTRTGQVQVSLQFDDEGTKLFSEITTRNTGKPVAIYLDNQPISIPRVNEPITSGSAVISGGFGYADARLLAQRLNSGALPVPVELLSQQKVDATLGADSLAKSFKAGIAGLLLVMLFMALYYRLPGLLSVISLGVYAVLNLALFKTLGVTLTLSGIAGFILSIGMAVDANVLVFERLKEELRLGKSLRTAMEESFLRAWPSIRDGHVTTLISCVVLVWFGTGFVQGFAVVLGTGVLVSLFTAITVTRTIMRLVFAWFKEPNRLFLGYKKHSI